MNSSRSLAALAAVAALGAASVAHAQIAVSANDNKVRLDNGVVKVVPNPPSDTVSVIDLGSNPPRVIAEVQAPVSVAGPPSSVAITPDEGLALVTASMRVDPSDATKQIPHSVVSVIDLKAGPPRVIATLEAGKGASGVSINRAGNLALVSNRTDGTVSVYTIQGKTVTPVGTVEVGGTKAGGGHVAITPDGKTALVARVEDHRVSVLSIDGSKVEYTKRDIAPGLRPAALDIAPSGTWAVIANLGGGAGDNDVVSLVDLRMPARVVDNITVGPTPEGIKVSPDGSTIAVVVHNGSNRATTSPFYNDSGRLVLLRASGNTLVKVAEGRIGNWSQGVAFSPDGKRILVGNMVQKDYWVFEWDGVILRDTGQRVPVNGGAAAIRTPDK